ncbi:HoxN/HupN/NixA family nickel/cobalt transporter [Cucumibacter marinus]|uniref:HoxN/HupN/NixA family nickel/cobalt transporter n=1 Tax=Cucumibacter marinus TaxID=1121252 RepID=UPI00040FA495|nr:DUF1007 family protein [Cucumibacter marinus]
MTAFSWTGCFRALASAAALWLAMTAGAWPHPHIFIDAVAELQFDDSGALTGLTHRWRFDPATSAWMVQGLDENGDGTVSPAELQPLADDNTAALYDFDFYTTLNDDGEEVKFSQAIDPGMVFEGGMVTLSFTIAPVETVTVSSSLEVEVGDPEYYVAFAFEGNDGAVLKNAPPSCSVEVNEPRPISAELENRLFDLGPEVTELPPDLKQAMRDVSNVVIVSCDGEPATASEAVASQARNKAATPFTVPPSEPNIGATPQTGILGWVQRQQQQFYRSLTQTLAALKQDNNAFWVLGTLSFLYGVFHAAGPGHGKMVISSYVVARESEVGRGVALSFAAAMVQSLVAIAFVLVAAGALRLTSLALEDAAAGMATGSYALIALLGAWLVWRKLTGRGHHHHDHSHDHHNGHDHGHEDHGHAHHHVVGPGQAKGSLREMAGVVLAVGLRPCSGALIVLAFALTQGVLLAGIVATLLMGLGTALTVSVLAGLAVLFKDWARRAAKGGHAWAGRLVSLAELLGAIAVFAFGVVLLMASIS